MANTTPSANMGFEIPIVSEAPGPQWASDLNQALREIDQHTHAPGFGLPIGTNAMLINADLPFNGFNATGLRTVRMNTLASSASSGTDRGCIYVFGQDLWFNDTLGRPIQLTTLGSVFSSSGNITNLVAPASVVYNSGTGTFIFSSSATIAASIDVGSILLRNLNSGSNAVTIQAPQTFSSWSWTVPTNTGTNRFAMTTDGTGTSRWAPAVGSAEILNYSLLVTVGANALTVALKGANGNDPSPTNPVDLYFRSATSGTGTTTVLPSTAALSITIPSGTTLGMLSNQPESIYAYAMNNSGVPVLGLATTNFVDEGSMQSTTAIASGTSRVTLYSTSGLSSLPTRLLGRIKTTQATAGTYALAPSEVSLLPIDQPQVYVSEVRCTASIGYGSSGTDVRRFIFNPVNNGSAITYRSSSTIGDTFWINEAGTYGITMCESSNAARFFGIGRNAPINTAIDIVPIVNRLAIGTTVANSALPIPWTGRLVPGDVITSHSDGGGAGTTAHVSFHIVKLSG